MGSIVTQHVAPQKSVQSGVSIPMQYFLSTWGKMHMDSFPFKIILQYFLSTWEKMH